MITELLKSRKPGSILLWINFHIFFAGLITPLYVLIKNQINSLFSRGIGEVHLRVLAPGQHSFEETSQRWRTARDNVSDLTGPGIEPTTFRTDEDVFNHYVKPTGTLQDTECYLKAFVVLRSYFDDWVLILYHYLLQFLVLNIVYM